MFSSRSSVLASLASLLAGVTLGVLAPLLEAADASALHVAHLVLAAGWSWAALAFVVGTSCESRVKSAVLAPASLAAGVIAYYVTKLERGGFLEWVNVDDPSQGTQIYWAGFLSKTLFWSVVAIVLGTFLGLAGNLARNRGIRGLPFQVVIPLVAIAETSMRLRTEASLQGELAGETWNATRFVAVASVIILVGHVMTARWFRTSVWQERR
ncbi:hypothetical protein [Streptomyces sp. Amel2xC10]|uniref:hypothetical protein n=1 Tax=Streptomyces sp. Amel2xC10 TaxID=1305826 RepID=UPI000A08F7C5|nr:hypothetical protein [Streptomyces sp. Amel2xC10]SMF58469.1 hypothetical protein SAMN02745830_04583 [Streptomyces sp. Amel2xC10]